MKNMMLSFLAVAGMAAGVVLLQSSTYPKGVHAQSTPAQREQKVLDFLSSHLDLSADQQQQAKSILDAARQQALPVAQQIKQGYQSIMAAVKAGQPDSELDRLGTQQGVLAGQLSAIHAKAAAQFYAMLTPDQKAKADTLQQLAHDLLGSRFGV